MRRTPVLALALSLALVSGAFAGENAGATFSLTSAATISGVGAGETVTLDIAGSGFVGVKQLDITLQVSDAANFNLAGANATLDPTSFAGWLPPLGATVDATDPTRVRIGAALLDLTGTNPGANDDVSFSVTIPTSASFTAGTTATVSVASISIGPSSSDRDEFDAGAIGISVLLNPPVSDPTLTASSATDATLDFSAVGDGSAQDGSAGEVTFGVAFADADGAAASGQTISFAITNNGAESVFELGSGTTIAAGGSATVDVATASGAASITLDAEGDKNAGSTTASVTASTSAPNSDGADVALSVSFSATWDVPVPAELASFAGTVTSDMNVELQWAVPSQTNNLGWEVYRSLDNAVFEQVGNLVDGDGTTDVYRTYSFLDEDAPAVDVLFYYLRQIDLDGTASRSNVIEVLLAPTAVGEQAVPTVSVLDQNFPNPFNPETTIRFDLADEASVTLRVFDVTGQVVRTIIDGPMGAGSFERLWDGRDSRGVRVGSGVYFYELRAGTFTSMKKMTLLQ